MSALRQNAAGIRTHSDRLLIAAFKGVIHERLPAPKDEKQLSAFSFCFES